MDVLLPSSHAGSTDAPECRARHAHAAGSAALTATQQGPQQEPQQGPQRGQQGELQQEWQLGQQLGHQQEQQHGQQQGQQDPATEAVSQNTAAGPRLLHDRQQPLLLIEDDAAGLSPQQMRRMLGLPSRANSASSLVAAIGGASPSSVGSHAAACAASQWPDLVHAALRLGSTALVLTKRRGQGASVGLLHASPAPTGRDEAWLEVAVVDFAADGSRQLAAGRAVTKPAALASSGAALAWQTAAAAAAASAASSAWAAAADTVCRRWPGGATESQLAAQLASLPEQGTCMLIAGLHTCAAGAAGAAATERLLYELDWSSDPADVQLAAGALCGIVKRCACCDLPACLHALPRARLAAQLPGCQGASPACRADVPQQGQQQQQQQAPGEAPAQALRRRAPLHRSLRAYLALLFLRWPEGWRLRLRGVDVQHQRIRCAGPAG